MNTYKLSIIFDILHDYRNYDFEKGFDPHKVKMTEDKSGLCVEMDTDKFSEKDLSDLVRQGCTVLLDKVIIPIVST